MLSISLTRGFHLLADQASSNCRAAFLPCSAFLGDYCVVVSVAENLAHLSVFKHNEDREGWSAGCQAIRPLRLWSIRLLLLQT